MAKHEFEDSSTREGPVSTRARTRPAGLVLRVSYTRRPNRRPTKQASLRRCPKPRQGQSPWTSILMRVSDERLSGA
jgi:hypothetical protein